jgi:hypothetical protein
MIIEFRALRFALLLAMGVSMGCSTSNRVSDADAGGQPSRPDPSPMDGGTPALVDASTLPDSGSDPRGADAATGGGKGASCTLNFDCSPGLYCIDGSCSTPTTAVNCCEDDGCSEGLICGPDCTCGDPSEVECIPDCTAEQFCEFGWCSPLCEREGCPEGELCGFEGCITPLCTAAECSDASPPTICEPTSGCFDPCDAATTMECMERGAHCVLGECMDDACAESCGFRVDCCGESVCMRNDAGDPICPEDCIGETRATPEASSCACNIDAACVDYRDLLSVWTAGK